MTNQGFDYLLRSSDNSRRHDGGGSILGIFLNMVRGGIMEGLDISILAAIENLIEKGAVTMFTSVAEAFRNNLRPLLEVLVILMFGVQIIKHAFGDPGHLFTQLYRTCLRAALVVGIGFSSTMYVVDIQMIAFNWPKEMAGWFSFSGDTKDPNELIGNALRAGWELAVKINTMSSGMVETAMNFLSSVIIVGFTVYVCAQSYFMLIISQLGLALVLSVGPLFILCALFDSTRGFFEGWIRQVVTLMLQYVFIVGAANIMFFLWIATFEAAQEGSRNGIFAFAMSLFIGFVSKKVMEEAYLFARGIAGAWHMGVTGAFSSMRTAASSALAAAGAVTGATAALYNRYADSRGGAGGSGGPHSSGGGGASHRQQRDRDYYGGRGGQSQSGQRGEQSGSGRRDGQSNPSTERTAVQDQHSFRSEESRGDSGSSGDPQSAT
jgi:type IV secretion system protein VirB6